MGERPVQSVGTTAYDALLKSIRTSREEKGVSQRELSRRLGQPFTYIVKVESGSRRIDVVELIQICFGLDVDPVELVGGLAALMKTGSKG